MTGSEGAPTRWLITSTTSERATSLVKVYQSRSSRPATSNGTASGKAAAASSFGSTSSTAVPDAGTSSAPASGVDDGNTAAACSVDTVSR